MSRIARLAERGGAKRVALLRAPTSRLRMYKWYWLLASKEPSLGLLYVGSHLRRHGHEVVLLDGERLGQHELLRRLSDFGPDVVGLTGATFSFFEAAALATAVRAREPDAVLVMGGPHVTALPEDSLARIPALDACVVGEGEETLLELASGRAAGEIAGLCHRGIGGATRNPPRTGPLVLDDYHLDWDLLSGFPDGYRPALQSARGQRPISLVASRGCPFPCTFCAGPVALGKRRRAHSPKRLVEMMRECRRRFGTSSFYFHDDHFTLDRPWLDEFCDRMAAEREPLRWSCASRVEPLDDATLTRMRRAGCYQIGIGGESGSVEVLKRLDKRLTTTRLEDGIRRIRGHGIEVKLYLIVGTPGETARDLATTLSFTALLRPDHVQVLYYTPLPGSPSWRTEPVDPSLWPRMNLLNRMPCTELPTWRLRLTELRLYGQTYGARRLLRRRPAFA